MEQDMSLIIVTAVILAVGLIVGIYAYHNFIKRTNRVSHDFNIWVTHTLLTENPNRLLDAKEIFLELHSRLLTSNVKSLLEDRDIKSLLDEIMGSPGKYGKTVVADVYAFIHQYHTYKLNKVKPSRKLSKRKMIKDIKSIFLPELQRYIETNK